MRKGNLTLIYAVLQALVWGAFGAVVGFTATYLLSCGLDNSEYGLVLALASGLAFLLQLALGELCSRLRFLTLHRSIALLSAVTIAMCALLLWKLGLALRIVLFSTAVIAIQIMPAMLNALAMAARRAGMELNYGLARGFGSLGYALMSYLTGEAIVRFDREAMCVIGIVMCLALVASLRFFPAVQTAQKQRAGGGSTQIWRNYRLLAMLLGTMLLYLSHNQLVNYMLQLFRSRGGDESSQGLASAISAVSELPVMFLFVLMLKKARCDSYLKLSALFVLLKCVLCYLAPNLAWLYAAQLTQSLGFALLYLATVHYVDAVVPPEDTVRAQTMLAASNILGKLIAFGVGGVLVERWGVQAMVAGAGICAAGGLVIYLAALEKLPGEGRQRA